MVERQMINIERALLACFLWSNDLGMDTNKAFILDVLVFTNQDRKLIASKINEVTDTEDKFYSLLNMEIENTVQSEWMDIAYYTPFGFKNAKEYHSKLQQDYRQKIVTGGL